MKAVKVRSARQIKASWREGEVVLSVPARASREMVVTALKEMAPRLMQAVENWRRADEERRQGPLHYMGQEVELAWRPGGRLRAGLAAGRLIICGVGSQAEAEEAAAFWLARQAERILPALVQSRALSMGLSVARVALRDQRTRWGSASARRTISLNWRLVMAPPEVIDYMIVHELSHLREMNHSPRFWAVVEAHCPEWRTWDRWLMREGGRLMARLPRISMAKALSASLADGPLP